MSYIFYLVVFSNDVHLYLHFSTYTFVYYETTAQISRTVRIWKHQNVTTRLQRAKQDDYITYVNYLGDLPSKEQIGSQ